MSIGADIRARAGTSTRDIWAAGDDPLVCGRITDEVPDVKTFRFAPASGARVSFHPGQYVTLGIPLDGETAWRSFTIASSPLRDDAIDLTIKTQVDGRATRWLHNNLRPGMSLKGRPPGGSFRLEAVPARPLVLVSAGSGATPMAAILRWLADQDARVPVHHLHVGRTRDDLMFHAELTALAERIGTWTLHWLVTRGPAEADILSGRPDTAGWVELIPTLGEAEVFACGPGGFMAQVAAAHMTAGGKAERFHQEGFGDRTAFAAPSEKAIGGGQVVHFLPSRKETVSRSGESLLEAALRAGVRIPNSCRQGICGTCLVRKVAGDVIMNHEGGISDDEIADGDILACCSYPLGPVTLKVSR